MTEDFQARQLTPDAATKQVLSRVRALDEDSKFYTRGLRQIFDDIQYFFKDFPDGREDAEILSIFYRIGNALTEIYSKSGDKVSLALIEEETRHFDLTGAPTKGARCRHGRPSITGACTKSCQAGRLGDAT